MLYLIACTTLLVLSVLFVSERLLAGRKVLLRPERLTADFEQVNGTLLATFHWRLSQNALELTAIEGFQFTWTLQSAAIEGQEDTLISQTQTIAPVRERQNSNTSKQCNACLFSVRHKHYVKDQRGPMSTHE